MKKLKRYISWKDISIFKKVGLGPGIVLLFLVGISFQSVSGISGILGDSKEVIYGNTLDAVFAQKEVDHLNWANRIGKLLNREDPKTLNIKTDHETCSPGKWLYSEERARAEEVVPALSPLLKAIEAPHREMHDSARAIKETFKPGHGDLDITLAKFRAGHAAWVSKLGEAIAEEAGGLYVYQSLIRTATQQAVSRIRAIDQRTDLDPEQRRELAYQALKSMRYGDDESGYLMHPHKPAMEGENHQLTVGQPGHPVLL